MLPQCVWHPNIKVFVTSDLQMVKNCLEVNVLFFASVMATHVYV